MSSVFVARQPVFTRDLRLFGYELLFRATEADETAEVLDEDAATRQLLMNTFTVIGLEHLVGRNPALINVGRDFLLQEAANRSLPTRGVILEVLETVMPDQDVIAAMDTLRNAGVRICLDDFQATSQAFELVDHADIIKIEVEGRPTREIARVVEQVKRPGVRLLAEKIEDRAQFRDCLDLGFHYFQGYFLSRPRTVRGAAIPTSRLPTVRLLAAIQKPELEVGELERIIATDVGLSYRLLRYLNSAYYQLQRPLDSIRQAILYLGLHELRRWASLMAIASVDDKPSELISMLTVRARMCELLGHELHAGDGDTFFTVGLFSGLDAVLDVPLSEVVAELPLSRDVHQALLHRQGPAGTVLDCVLHYESGDWDWLQFHEYPSETVIQAYLDAIDWTRSILEQYSA